MLLAGCRSGAKVTLFEAESTCGGHTLTDSTGQWPVDLGFQVNVAVCWGQEKGQKPAAEGM